MSQTLIPHASVLIPLLNLSDEYRHVVVGVAAGEAPDLVEELADQRFGVAGAAGAQQAFQAGEAEDLVRRVRRLDDAVRDADKAVAGIERHPAQILLEGHRR